MLSFPTLTLVFSDVPRRPQNLPSARKRHQPAQHSEMAHLTWLSTLFHSALFLQIFYLVFCSFLKKKKKKKQTFPFYTCSSLCSDPKMLEVLQPAGFDLASWRLPILPSIRHSAPPVIAPCKPNLGTNLLVKCPGGVHLEPTDERERNPSLGPAKAGQNCSRNRLAFCYYHPPLSSSSLCSLTVSHVSRNVDVIHL